MVEQPTQKRRNQAPFSVSIITDSPMMPIHIQLFRTSWFFDAAFFFFSTCLPVPAGGAWQAWPQRSVQQPLLHQLQSLRFAHAQDESCSSSR